MPKTFTAKEKEIIRKTLLSNGKKFFSKYGLKKTSITELTSAAGIAQGTFYNFFESKEDLYFEILEQEESDSAIYLEDIVKSSKSAKESIRNIIKCTSNMFEKNQFIRRVFESKDYDLMVRKLSDKKLENHQKNDTLRVLNTIMSIKQKDELIDTPPEIIAGLLRGIVILSSHKDEIGREIYPEVVDLLADIVANGLVK
jgi:AcrR family transcriptional regulator